MRYFILYLLLLLSVKMSANESKIDSFLLKHDSILTKYNIEEYLNIHLNIDSSQVGFDLKKHAAIKNKSSVYYCYITQLSIAIKSDHECKFPQLFQSSKLAIDVFKWKNRPVIFEIYPYNNLLNRLRFEDSNQAELVYVELMNAILSKSEFHKNILTYFNLYLNRTESKRVYYKTELIKLLNNPAQSAEVQNIINIVFSLSKIQYTKDNIDYASSLIDNLVKLYERVDPSLLTKETGFILSQTLYINNTTKNYEYVFKLYDSFKNTAIHKDFFYGIHVHLAYAQLHTNGYLSDDVGKMLDDEIMKSEDVRASCYFENLIFYLEYIYHTKDLVKLKEFEKKVLQCNGALPYELIHITEKKIVSPSEGEKMFTEFILKKGDKLRSEKSDFIFEGIFDFFRRTQSRENIPLALVNAYKKRIYRDINRSNMLFNIQRTEQFKSIQNNRMSNFIVNLQKESQLLDLEEKKKNEQLVYLTLIFIFFSASAYAGYVFIKNVKAKTNELKALEKNLVEKSQLIESQNNNLKKNNESLQNYAEVIAQNLKYPIQKFNQEFDELASFSSSDTQSEDIANMKSIIRTQAETLTKTLNNVLELSKVHSKDFTEELFSLTDLIKLIYGELEYKSIISIGDLPSINSNKNLNQLIYQNLLINATKFRRPGVDAKIEVGYIKPNTIFVKDNGIGISKDQFENIFLPTKKLNGINFPGQGMGLYNVNKMSTKLKIKLSVDSEVGVGTTFYLEYPEDLIA